MCWEIGVDPNLLNSLSIDFPQSVIEVPRNFFRRLDSSEREKASTAGVGGFCTGKDPMDAIRVMDDRGEPKMQVGVRGVMSEELAGTERRHRLIRLVEEGGCSAGHVFDLLLCYGTLA
jgi:hypothetical protein